MKKSFTSWFFSGAIISLPKLVMLVVTIVSTAGWLITRLSMYDKATLAIYFAVIQAAVCLVLFVLVPRPVPPDNPLSLKLTDLIAPHNLIKKLQDGNDPNRLILTQLTNSRRKIERYRDGDSLDIRVLSVLMDELNGLINSDSLIYDHELFEHSKLSQATLKICRSKSGSARRANRMLIEDLFSEEIAQYPRNEETVKRACRNIRLWIQLMFLCWVIYYGVTALSAYTSRINADAPQLVSQTARPDSVAANLAAPSPQTAPAKRKDDQRIYTLFLNFFSALTAVFLFFLYVEMSELTVSDSLSPSDSRRNDPSQEQVRDAFDQKAFFACVAFVVVCADVVAVMIPEQPKFADSIETIIACGSGVVMALVVGRLGSKFMDPGTGVLAILYLYAVIQPVAIYFSAMPNARFYATTLALFLKTFLWLVFYWAFTDGKLWIYVMAIRNLLLSNPRTPPEFVGAR